MLRICFGFVLALTPLVAAAAPEGRIRVVDADTWWVGETKVRIHGIDAPEGDQTCLSADGASWACGQWASQQARIAYHGQYATCTELDRDRYERVVARCMVDGNDAGQQMVSLGMAVAFRKYSMEYDLDEKGAAVNRRGIHSGSFQRPAAFRAQDRVATATPQVSATGCRIKGNISSKGVRIYHVPGQRHYDRTRISKRKGERWFCSEDAARAAGWRRARR